MAKDPRILVSLPWPVGGQNEEAARVEQPPRSSMSMSNMVTYGRDGRKNGETRPAVRILFGPYANSTGLKEMQGMIQTSYFAAGVKATRLVHVAGGTVYVGGTAIAGGPHMNTTGKVQMCAGFVTGILPTDSINYVILVDGTNTKVVTMSNSPSIATLASLATDGTPPTTRTLCCIWRNRLVLAGPNQNWQMSRVGDYFDWNYGTPTVSDVSRPIADTNTDTTIPGGISDALVALIPWSDKQLLMAGDSRLFLLTGDPAAGGQSQKVSDSFRIIGPNSWCTDPDGAIWIAATSGLYKYVAGLENISNGREQPFFNGLSGISGLYVNMAFERDFQRLYIFVCDNTGTTAKISMIYNPLSRGDSFEPIVLDVQHGPVSVLVWDADVPGDRKIYLGGRTRAATHDLWDAVFIYQFSAGYSSDQLGSAATYITAAAQTAAALPACTYTNGTLGVGATLQANANGALGQINSITVNVGDNIVVNDQSSDFQNGLYVINSVGSAGSKWLLTRHTAMDQSAEFGVALAYVTPTALFKKADVPNIVVGTDNFHFATTSINSTYYTTKVAIGAYVLIGPFLPTPGHESKTYEMSITLGEPPSGYTSSNFNCDWTMLAGRTVFEALNGTEGTATGTFTASGMQSNLGVRLSGQAFFLYLSNSTLDKMFNYADGELAFLPAGRIR